MESHKQQRENHGEIIHSENNQNSLQTKPKVETKRSSFRSLKALLVVLLSKRPDPSASALLGGEERSFCRERGGGSGLRSEDAHSSRWRRGPQRRRRTLAALARSLAPADAGARLTWTALRRLFILNPYRVGVNSSDFIPAPRQCYCVISHQQATCSRR